MSEFFYGPLDFQEESEEIEDDALSFLKKAKRIGEMPTGIQIYLEDYVYTYLYQYAKLNRGEEKAIALVGYYIEEMERKIGIINGAIQLNPSLSDEGTLLSEEQLMEVEKQRSKYFHNCELMGWMHTQPGYGIFLTTQDIRLQKRFFPKPHQSLMIIDPIEDTEAFFVWDQEEPRSAEGYFIYYDKNENMQNYMVNHKIGVSNEELIDKEEDVVMHFRKKDRERRKEIQGKKVVHLVTSLSVVLFLMCITMAIGLIQHRERLSKLETELDHMDSNYTSLLSQLNEENVQVVFAEEDSYESREEIPEKTSALSDENEILIEETEDTIIIEEKSKEEVKEEPPKVEQLKEEPIEPTKAVSQTNDFDTYTVKSGDNLNRICFQHYKTTDMVTKVVEFNNLESSNKIYEGQVLKLPRSE